MDALTNYLPVTFDKLRSITKGGVLLQSVKKFKSRWPDLKLRQHADWSQLEGFCRRSPLQSNKDSSCSENVWLFEPRCGPKSSNYFIKDTRGSNA
jgi:hypothetical protein